MRVVFFGTPDFAVPTLAALLAQPEFDVLGVVTQPDQPQGRGQKIQPSPVKVLAQQYHLPLWQPPRLRRDLATQQALNELNADVFVVVAYGQILPPDVLRMPRWGCVNGHGSLLPKYRGAAPIQWALVNGETHTGITIMLMDAGMDTGPMLAQQSVTIDLFTSLPELWQKLAQLTAELLVKTLPKLPELTPIPQDETQATYATLALATDYDCWHPEHASVSVDMVVNNLRKNVTNAQAVIQTAVAKIAAHPPQSKAHRALKNAIMTPLDKVPPATLEKLRPILAPYL